MVHARPALRTALGIFACSFAFATGCTSHAAGPSSTSASPNSIANPNEVAEAQQASPALVRRADDLVLMINAERHPTEIFSPDALEKAPAERLLGLATAVRTRNGPALGVSRIEAKSPNLGTVYIDFENAQFPVTIRVADEAPHFINGMQIED